MLSIDSGGKSQYHDVGTTLDERFCDGVSNVYGLFGGELVILSGTRRHLIDSSWSIC